MIKKIDLYGYQLQGTSLGERRKNDEAVRSSLAAYLGATTPVASAKAWREYESKLEKAASVSIDPDKFSLSQYTMPDVRKGDIFLEYLPEFYLIVQGKTKRGLKDKARKKVTFSHTYHAALGIEKRGERTAEKLELWATPRETDVRQVKLDDFSYMGMARQFRIKYHRLLTKKAVEEIKGRPFWKTLLEDNDNDEDKALEYFVSRYLAVGTGKDLFNIDELERIQFHNSEKDRESSPFRTKKKTKGTSSQELYRKTRDMMKDQNVKQHEICSAFAAKQNIFYISELNRQLAKILKKSPDETFFESPWPSKIRWSGYHTGRLEKDLLKMKERGLVSEIQPPRGLLQRDF